MPDRTDRGAVTTLTTGVKNIAYSAPFNGGNNGGFPIVSVVIYNAQQGDDYRITNQTLSGFDVDVINAGTLVARPIGHTTEGY